MDFLGANGTGSKKDGWLVYNNDDASAGIGGYTPQIRFAEAGDDNEVGGALAATALTQLVLPPSLIGQSSKADAFCVVVSAVDKLGNESGLPDADAACKSATDYETEGDDGTPEYAAGLLAGVDTQVPTIVFSPTSPKENAASLIEFQVRCGGRGVRDSHC